MKGALRAEWGKAWSLRSSWLCLLGSAVLAAVASFSLANDFRHGVLIGEHAETERMAAQLASGPAVLLALVAFSAFAMGVVTSEYAHGSIRTTFCAEPRRVVVLGAKVATGMATGVVTGVVLGWGGVALATAVLGSYAAPATEPLWLTGLRTGALFGVGAALVVGLGALIRSAVATLAAATVLLLGLQLLPSAVGRWTPAGAAAEFLGVGQDAYPAEMGLLVIIGWAAAVVAAAAVLVRRRDA